MAGGIAFDPWDLALRAGLVPEFVLHPPGKRLRQWSRDDKLQAIAEMRRGFVELLSRRGIFADPGPCPVVIVEPLPEPKVTDSEEDHKRYRRVMDEWFDGPYLEDLLPRRVIWEAAEERYRQSVGGRGSRDSVVSGLLLDLASVAVLGGIGSGGYVLFSYMFGSRLGWLEVLSSFLATVMAVALKMVVQRAAGGVPGERSLEAGD